MPRIALLKAYSNPQEHLLAAPMDFTGASSHRYWTQLKQLQSIIPLHYYYKCKERA